VRWIKKKTGPAAAPLADKAALDEAEKAEVIVVAYFKELKVGWVRVKFGCFWVGGWAAFGGF
jgi:hypothetical protein